MVAPCRVPTAPDVGEQLLRPSRRMRRCARNRCPAARGTSAVKASTTATSTSAPSWEAVQTAWREPHPNPAPCADSLHKPSTLLGRAEPGRGNPANAGLTAHPTPNYRHRRTTGQTRQPEAVTVGVRTSGAGSQVDGPAPQRATLGIQPSVAASGRVIYRSCGNAGGAGRTDLNVGRLSARGAQPGRRDCRSRWRATVHCLRLVVAASVHHDPGESANSAKTRTTGCRGKQISALLLCHSSHASDEEFGWDKSAQVSLCRPT
jgi:hypothetical protein